MFFSQIDVNVVHLNLNVLTPCVLHVNLCVTETTIVGIIQMKQMLNVKVLNANLH